MNADSNQPGGSSTYGGRFHDDGPSPADGKPATDPFAHLGTHIREFREYMAYFAATKKDALKVTVRTAAIYAVLGVLGLMAGAGIIITASVLLLAGLASAISTAIGVGPWAGDLIVAVVVFGGLALVAYIGVSRLTGTARSQLVKDYERRKQQQRRDYGHDVSDRDRQAQARR